MAKKVFIGVGHGGSDPGAVANGFKEKDLNLAIAISVNEVLLRHGVSVQMSRSKDDNESLTEKINECNAFNPELALDIHNNAGAGDGAEVYYYSSSTKGKSCATQVLDAIVQVGQNSRGIKANTSFRFLNSTKAPAILIECAFVDNKKDIAIIDTAAEQKAMGVAIAKGILKTLGIAYVEEKKPTTESGKLYRVQVGAYSVKTNAENMQKRLKADGYDAVIV